MSQSPTDPNGHSSTLVIFGTQLRIHRERAGLSQERLGTKMGFVGGYIGNVERGERKCEREFAVAADVALDTRGALAHLWDETIKKAALPSWFLDWTGTRRRRPSCAASTSPSSTACFRPRSTLACC
jgi:transcriptional regulator with XRE-family HTH domain